MANNSSASSDITQVVLKKGGSVYSNFLDNSTNNGSASSYITQVVLKKGGSVYSKFLDI